MWRDVIMKFKKLLCTAFLALVCCAISAAAYTDAAYTDEDIRDAQILVSASYPYQGNRREISDAHRRRCDDILCFLEQLLGMDYADIVRDPRRIYIISIMPVLKRHYYAGTLNNENFQAIVLKTISLFDWLKDPIHS